MDTDDTGEYQTGSVSGAGPTHRRDLLKHCIILIVDHKHEIRIVFPVDHINDHRNDKGRKDREPDTFISHAYFPSKKPGQDISHDKSVIGKLMPGKEIA